MSFRRFVHLVVNDMNVRRCTYSLRSIDMSPLFRRPPPDSTTDPPRPPPPLESTKPSPLPTPAMSFCPPRSRYRPGIMKFMLLGGRHNEVVATDHTGRAVLYDPDRHAVRTVRGFTNPKNKPVALTVGGDHLYVLDVLPHPSHKHTRFECLEYDGYGDEDWYPRVLPPPPPPPPYSYNELDLAMKYERSLAVDSCAVSGDGSCIWITDQRAGTYAFDTVAEVWSKAGNWVLPFNGVAEYVPELGLWFGLRDEDHCELCAVDLMPPTPTVRGLWTDLVPPAEWPVLDPKSSRLVHMGGARFCIARFFNDDYDSCNFPVTRAVFTAVEVEHCAGTDGGLHMVKHGSKLFILLHDMTYWVL